MIRSGGGMAWLQLCEAAAQGGMGCGWEVTVTERMNGRKDERQEERKKGRGAREAGPPPGGRRRRGRPRWGC